MTLSIAIIITHFFCDWILQPRRMAENKSSNVLWLWAHLAINTLGFAALLLVFQKFALVPLYINLVSHALIDWNIWRGYKWWVKKKIYQEVWNTVPGETTLNCVLRYQEDALKNWQDKNLYAKDYTFYATIALDQCLHLVIALWLFA